MLSHPWRQLLELVLVLFLLTIWISYCLCLAHIATRNLDEFTVSFIWDRSSSSYFTRKLFEFGAHANSLDHLDCSHGVLAVFDNIFFISGSKFLSTSMKAVVRTCACAISLDKIVYVLLTFLYEMEVHLPILRGSCSNLELMRILLIIWIAVMVYW